MTAAATEGGGAPSPPVVPAEDPRRGVDDELRRFLGAQRDRLASVDPELAVVAETAEEYLEGGKRLRPAFCYWGWRAVGRPSEPGLVRAAAALELLQACALVHDDVMDSSDTRRGRPSAHRRFEAHHLANRWRGDAPHFGVSAAVLLGDLFLAWSDQLFNDSGLPDASLQRGRRVFDLMRTELMAGQYLDLVVQAQPAPTRDTIGRVLRYKSAKYTIEHPLRLGAELAGGDPATVAGLGEFGLPLGEAFQLRDDLLGVFGDPELTGKPAGDDLREGKQTLLIAVAFDAATPQQREVLRQGFGNSELDLDGLDLLRQVLRDTGAVEHVEREIAARHERAIGALRSLGLPEPAAGALASLAEASVTRVR